MTLPQDDEFRGLYPCCDTSMKNGDKCPIHSKTQDDEFRIRAEGIVKGHSFDCILPHSDAKSLERLIAEALRQVHDKAVEECAKCVVPDGNPAIALEKIRSLKKEA